METWPTPYKSHICCYFECFCTYKCMILNRISSIFFLIKHINRIGENFLVTTRMHFNFDICVLLWISLSSNPSLKIIRRKYKLSLYRGWFVIQTLDSGWDYKRGLSFTNILKKYSKTTNSCFGQIKQSMFMKHLKFSRISHWKP